MEVRRPQRTVSVEAVTLDAALSEAGLCADHVKVDTQGAEYEILSGAAAQLKRHVFAVVAETWTYPVHKGQQLSPAIEGLMLGSGYEIMERQLHGRWGRRSDVGLERRRQETSFDILFFAGIDTVLQRRPGAAKLLKAAAIADVYGFPGYALDLLTAAMGDGAEREPLEWARQAIMARRRAGSGTKINDAAALALRRLARWHDRRRWPPLGG